MKEQKLHVSAVVFSVVFSTLFTNVVFDISKTNTGKAFAQKISTEAPSDKKTITNAKGEKVTVVDFDDANIEGKAKAPDGFVVQSRKSGKFRGMIELRKDFRPQMEQAAQDALASMRQN